MSWDRLTKPGSRPHLGTRRFGLLGQPHSSNLPAVCARFAAIRARLPLTLIVSLALAALALVAVGCGSSSKPDYCSNVSDLQSSVNTLKNVQPQSGVVSTLQTDIQKVQSNTNAVVTSAKQDFPTQTSALESSVSTLSASVKALPSAPTPQQLVALVPQISSVATAAQNLESATSSACD